MSCGTRGSGQGYIAHCRTRPWSQAVHLPTHPLAEGLGPGSGPRPEVRAIAGAAAHPELVLWPGSVSRLQPRQSDRHVLPKGSGRIRPLVTAWVPSQPHQHMMAKTLKWCLRCHV